MGKPKGILRASSCSAMDASKGEEMQVVTRGDADPEKRKSNAERRAARNSRVHFGDFENLDGTLASSMENHLLLADPLKEEMHKTLSIYLGLLQEAHRYDIRFAVRFDDIKQYCVYNDEKLKMTEGSSQTQATKLSWEENEKEGQLLVITSEVEVAEGVTTNFDDEIILCSESVENKVIRLRLIAQVLSKGQGTPALKNGVKCLGHSFSNSPEDSPKGDTMDTTDQLDD